MQLLPKFSVLALSFFSRFLPGSQVVCAGLAFAIVGLASPPAHAAESGSDRVLTVMTRNLDNGTDFGLLLGAKTPAQLIAAVSATYAEVVISRIPERAEGIAQEIEAAQPDLVGLQEVFTYRTGPLGGPATTVAYDALQSLLDALERRGLHYAPVAVLSNFDAELPAFNRSSGFFDVRVTDHDVVLARTDLPVSQLQLDNIQAQHFATNASLNRPVGAIQIPHGWISVDGKIRGKTVRFVTTHLESTSSEIQAAQATELIQGPANTMLPVIFAGDFNSDAQSSDPAQSAAYRVILGAGYADAWSTTHAPGDPGYTWPLHGEDPFTPFATPFQRIDLVLSVGRVRPLAVKLIGNQLTDLTPSGLWPSDHAGLVASFIVEP
jgi:endonuclease/exonuclease/phosphatase family metal-dependent hydrolase